MENDFLNSLLKERERLTVAIDRVNSLLELYQPGVIRMPTIPETENVKSLPTFTDIDEGDYKKKDTAPNKVIAALRLLGQATSSEVAQKLIALDPETFTEKKAIEDSRYYLSQLQRTGTILASPHPNGGRSYLYSIRPKADNNASL